LNRLRLDQDINGIDIQFFRNQTLPRVDIQSTILSSGFAGTGVQNQLISGVSGNHANLNIDTNSLYGFRSANVMAAISPLPLVMIQSTSDTASPPKVGRTLFATARDPKQYVLIKASNHRFSGAREEFYSALTNAVAWMREATKNGKSTQTAVMKLKS